MAKCDLCGGTKKLRPVLKTCFGTYLNLVFKVKNEELRKESIDFIKENGAITLTDSFICLGCIVKNDE